MKTKFFLLLLLIALLPSCHAQRSGNLIPASDPSFAYMGRVSLKNPAMARFTYPGVQIHASFTGTSVAMKMKPGSGYFMIELDDQKPFKVQSKAAADKSKPQPSDSIVNIASGLKPGAHRLTITLCNEGLKSRPEFYGLLLDDGCSLAGKPTLPERKIEFLGNSITCALGIEDYSKDLKDASPATQNAYYSFALQTARKLNAQHLLVARSGIGIYRNNSDPKTGSKNNLQAYYPYTLFTTDEGAERWDFKRYVPDVVCINLGTNDTSYPAYDSRLLTNAFVNLAHTIRGNYPQAKIVLLSGTMRKGKLLAGLLECINNAVDILQKEGESEVYRYDFAPADGSLGYGSFKHPSLREHTRMAEELSAYLRSLMGW